ncbi:MAG: glutathione S-transferase N-terminal domain-containing protein [Alphaproteobacteria bacterium]|nr:glutathione S-transferase N-terminal domain-containing protein [Alphaproteobacteria bacterium]
MVDLVHLSYSPWSERARWILDHTGVAWRSVPYTPTLSEPWLRWRLRRFAGSVSVPVLFTPSGAIPDSWDIAVWATRGAPALMPEGTREIDATADEALRSGRAVAGRRVLADREALRASRPFPASKLGPVGTWLTADGWRRVLRKYREDGMDDAAHRARQVAALEALEQAVGDGPFVHDAFSYADITAASALSFVAPHANLGLDPAAARAWADPELAERFAGLVAWRDQLVRDFRVRM